MAPDRGLSDRKTSGVKGNKTRITYAFTVNADGSDKLPPLIIGKWKRPKAFGRKSGRDLGFLYYSNAKAWMTTVIYQEWLRDWDRKLHAKGRKVLLLQDNFSAHVAPDNLRAVRVENLEPNLTSHVQPNDQGIIRCFKAHYRARFVERAITRYDSNITPADIYKINQLEAMRLADAAWREVDASTIRHCWRKAGILPSFEDVPIPPPTISIASLLNAAASELNPANEQDPVKAAEVSVEEALDGLVRTGALQKSNRMSLEMLLNPVEERSFTQATDEEIFLAVQESQDDSEPSEADAEPAAPPPTRQEALQAASTLTAYVGTLDSSLARAVEDVVARLTRQMRFEAQSSMVATTLDSYFTCPT